MISPQKDSLSMLRIVQLRGLKIRNPEQDQELSLLEEYIRFDLVRFEKTQQAARDSYVTAALRADEKRTCPVTIPARIALPATTKTP